VKVLFDEIVICKMWIIADDAVDELPRLGFIIIVLRHRFGADILQLDVFVLVVDIPAAFRPVGIMHYLTDNYGADLRICSYHEVEE